MKALALLTVLAGAAPRLDAQPAQNPNDRHRMEITLERQEDSHWVVIDPGLVLESGDRVRFRFRASFDGYLYVMNQGTSGNYELLFPRQETGEHNKIQAGIEYRIPATEAWFRIAGPPGHDIVYWLVTPVELGASAPKYLPLPPPPDRPVPPSSLLPRCDDSILRARGLCIDSSAGPRGVSETDPLPQNFSALPRLSSRELVIMRRKNTSLIASPAARSAPVLYEFRLAHK